MGTAPSANQLQPYSSVAQLRYSLRCGLPRDRRTIWKALAREGMLRPLQCARENGCFWDTETCSEAAGRGHLAAVQ